MRICLTILFLGFLSNVNVSAQSDGPFFCQKPGTVLSYQEYNKKGKLTGTEEEIVMRSYTSGDTLWVESTSTSYNAAGNRVLESLASKAFYLRGTTYYIFDEAAVLDNEMVAGMEEILKTADFSVTPLVFDINGGWTPGQSVPDRKFEMNFPGMPIAMTMINRKFLGRETVTTEAGEYDCVKISFDVSMKVGPMEMKMGSQVQWFAPEVGLVREETYERNKLSETKVLHAIR